MSARSALVERTLTEERRRALEQEALFEPSLDALERLDASSDSEGAASDSEDGAPQSSQAVSLAAAESALPWHEWVLSPQREGAVCTRRVSAWAMSRVGRGGAYAGSLEGEGGAPASTGCGRMAALEPILNTGEKLDHADASSLCHDDASERFSPRGISPPSPCCGSGKTVYFSPRPVGCCTSGAHFLELNAVTPATRLAADEDANGTCGGTSARAAYSREGGTSVRAAGGRERATSARVAGGRDVPGRPWREVYGMLQMRHSRDGFRPDALVNVAMERVVAVARAHRQRGGGHAACRLVPAPGTPLRAELDQRDLGKSPGTATAHAGREAHAFDEQSWLRERLDAVVKARALGCAPRVHTSQGVRSTLNEAGTEEWEGGGRPESAAAIISPSATHIPPAHSTAPTMSLARARRIALGPLLV